MGHLPHATAEELGLDERQLQRAFDQLRQWTEGPDAPLPSAALLVGRRGRLVPPRYFGRQGPEPDAPPLRRDGMFLMASITKPVTCLAAMMLVERGQLVLADRVTRYIPDFAAHHKDETLVLHLLTHTSGLPDMLENNVELRRAHAPLERFIQGAIRDTVPLFPAGTDVRYQSMGTLVLAEIVQRLSGQTIHEFLRREVFDPLQLGSTGLGSRGFDRQRLVRVQTPDYQQGSDFDWNSRYWQELGAPWGGLFSTPEDFAVLCQLLLDGGQHGGVRLLASETVRRMTTNRLHEQPGLPEAVRRATPWGLGWRMNHPGASDSWSDLLDRTVFGHTGATGTMVWIDRRREGFCVLLTTAQRSQAPWRLVRLSNMVAAAFR
ncbi:MAG: beta-lactamase family protein [Pirellulaceae bacterium]|nr:beta-lactamase family protein [Pirellulaceae bacterium]